MILIATECKYICWAFYSHGTAHTIYFCLYKARCWNVPIYSNKKSNRKRNQETLKPSQEKANQVNECDSMNDKITAKKSVYTVYLLDVFLICTMIRAHISNSILLHSSLLQSLVRWIWWNPCRRIRNHIKAYCALSTQLLNL